MFRSGWNLHILSPISTILIFLTVTCGSEGPDGQPPGTEIRPMSLKVASSDRSRVEIPQVSESDIDMLVEGNTAFAVELFHQLAEANESNLFVSPYSISQALAMAFAGARGETASEMTKALGFSLGQDALHPAINALDQQLASRGAELPPDEKFTLEIANSVWGQDEFNFEGEFLDTLALNYGTGIRLVDFIKSTEEARNVINMWVEENTDNRIKDLVPKGALDSQTRLALVNAIFFKAAWKEKFSNESTLTTDFTLADTTTVPVQMMRNQSGYAYGEGEGYRAVEIPYVGGETSMVVLLPDEGRFNEIEDSLDGAKLQSIIKGLRVQHVMLGLPRFEFESKFQMSETLRQLGMVQAFVPDAADFSGMHTPPPNLFVREVIHQSFVSVDEEGTEAAASTAVIIGAVSEPVEVKEFIADRPFIFLIRDNLTNTVLFMGRLMEPSS